LADGVADGFEVDLHAILNALRSRLEVGHIARLKTEILEAPICLGREPQNGLCLDGGAAVGVRTRVVLPSFPEIGIDVVDGGVESGYDGPV
jgi:hypothetical protein